MFAIKLTEENLAKIDESLELNHFDLMSINVYLEANATYYIVRGYVGPRGELRDHAVLPEYILSDNFEIDFDHAKTDWDQIVRK